MNRVFIVQVSNTRVVRHYTLSAHSEDHALVRARTRFEKDTNKEVTGAWIQYEEDSALASSDEFDDNMQPEA